MNVKIWSTKLVREKTVKYDCESKITSPATLHELVSKIIGGRAQEVLLAILLNGANEVIGVSQISCGLNDRSLVHPRECFQAAILANSSAIILAHNHPSGQLVPSDEDRKTTVRMAQAGELLGIQVLEHLIVARDGYYSFKEHGEI